jgi:hypothetical protein
MTDDKIAWYENLGGGSFGPQQVITTSADAASSVYATDLDGDGDADVLSASWNDNKIAWYENLGGGSFGVQQVISTAAQGAQSVYATDLDGDGDADVLSASMNDNKIAYYYNWGGGNFGGQRVISTEAIGARAVYATDLDGDGDTDVLSASYGDRTIAWYENLRDSVGDICDCAPGDPGLAVRLEVEELYLGKEFSGEAVLYWTTVPETTTYALTRGELTGLAAGDFGPCLATTIIGTTIDDPVDPPAGSGYMYLIAPELGECGTLGYGTNEERLNQDGDACSL